MQRELGVGIVGYGFMGKVHTYAYHNMALFHSELPFKVRLVGVCNTTESVARQAVDQVGFRFLTTRYEDLLERKDIDIINCCTPNVFHKQLLIDAARAGKHIYCDKPLAMNVAESKEIVSAAMNAGIRHQMGLEYRFIPAMMRAKQLIDNGLLGNVFSFRCDYLHSGYIDRDRPLSWRLNRSIAGGGALMDMGPHPIDLVRFLLGDFKSVSAIAHTFISDRPLPEEPARRVPVEVDDVALLQAKLCNGSLGSIETSRLATGTNDELRLEIHGSMGAIRFNLMDPNWLGVYDCRDPDSPIGGLRGFKKIETVQRYPEPAVLPGPKFAVGWIRYHIASLLDFLTSVCEDKPTSSTFMDGLRIQEVIDAAYRSTAEGQWIDINLADSASMN